MVSVNNIGKNLKDTTLVKKLNHAKIMNALTSPNAAAFSVGALIVENQTCRVIANLTDEKETPKARSYMAITEVLHGLVAFFTLFAVRPAFFLGGLLLGKKLMAKNAFKAIDFKKIQDLKLPGLISDTIKNKKPGKIGKAFKSASESLGKFRSWCYEKAGLGGVDKAIQKTEDYNRRIGNNIREALFGNKPRKIVFETKKGLMSVTEKGRADKKFINDFMSKTANESAIKEAIKNKHLKVYGPGEKEAQKLHNKGKILLTKGTEQIGGSPKTHGLIKGAKHFGEAIGMMASLCWLSPLFTGKYVPVVLKKIEANQTNKNNTDNSKNNQINA